MLVLRLEPSVAKIHLLHYETEKNGAQLHDLCISGLRSFKAISDIYSFKKKLQDTRNITFFKQQKSNNNEIY